MSTGRAQAAESWVACRLVPAAPAVVVSSMRSSVSRPVAVRQPGASSSGLLRCPNMWPQLAEHLGCPFNAEL